MQLSDGKAHRPLRPQVPEAPWPLPPVSATTRSPDATSAVSSGAVAVCVDTCSAYHQIQFTLLGNTVTKEELRAELERQEQRYKEVYGGEVTTYAAQPEPERKPWRKRATVQDQAFSQELQKMEKELRPEER